MTLGYSYIDMLENVDVPPPSLNGGLYTGSPFESGAPWGNVAIVPEADTYTQNLQSANPPPGGMFIPSHTRLGNNTVNQFTHQPYGNNFNFMCRKPPVAQ